MAFHEYLNDGLEKHRDGALVLMDMDNLKPFNAEEGHMYGDELLKQVAEMLISNARPGDILGRYGGDEFIIYMPHASSETAIILMEEIRKLIEETQFNLKVEEKVVKARITVSIGIAVCPGHAENVIELLRKSDEALYRAKLDGRNRVCLPVRDERMKSKTNFYPSHQLERLSIIAQETKKSESFLLREALDDLVKKYTDLREREETLVEVQMGGGLLDLVDPSKGGPLLEEISLIRREIKDETGLVLPGVRVRDTSDLKPLEYSVMVKGAMVIKKEVAGFNDTTKNEIAGHLREVFREQITKI
jgi:diguanylate cyclase (GGDEF)-like protein